MAVQKLFNLLAIATLALFAVTFNAAPVTAIAAPHQHLNRAISHHGGIAKRSKRSTAGRCKHRPSSSPAPAPEKTPEPAPSSSKAPAPAKPTKEAEPAATTKAPEEAKPTTKAAEPTKAPAPPPAKPAKPAASGGGKKGNVGIAWDGGDSASLGNLVTDYVRWYVQLLFTVPLHVLTRLCPQGLHLESLVATQPLRPRLRPDVLGPQAGR